MKVCTYRIASAIRLPASPAAAWPETRDAWRALRQQ
jgi:hypothetical protein